MSSDQPSGPTPSRGDVLFVDDDQVFAEASAQILRGAGYKVQIAPDYRLALEVLESNALVDLLVCDISLSIGLRKTGPSASSSMPGMSWPVM
jgi:CheY-like chemotaxis protein